MARLAVYGAISTVLAGVVIANAFAQRSNFYAACIYLYKSNACMMIILNLGLFLTIIAGHLVQIVFFGNLRALEVEHLYERAWYAVTETCLAMTIFKDEFDTLFVVMFTVLLFLKVFHWLCQDRVDSMEQSPEIPLSFHVRMVTMIAILVSLDVLLVLHAIDLVALKGPNMMIMFGFEYTLLATSLLASFGKYVLHTIDLRSEEPWENKSMLLFYLDLVADFIKLVTYLFFFMVILVCYGLPLHIIRDVYMTMRSFLQKCKDLIQYRKATRNMNERYPDASPAELAALSDPICIICREEMVGHHPHPSAAATGANSGAANQGANGVPAAPPPATPRPSGSNTNVPKKLPCGHVFHFHCLKSWLERQQSCPTCRRLVLEPPTPTPTPVPAAAGDAAAQGAGIGGAAGIGAGQQGGQVPGFGNFGNNNAQPLPGHGAHPGPFLHNQGMGYPMFAPQGHYPLAGWHPQMMVAGGALPGAIPPEGARPATGAGAGAGGGAGSESVTTAAAGNGAGAGAGAGIPGAAGVAHANYIPHFSIPNITHPIPGFIPLFPIGGDRQAQNAAAAPGTTSQQGAGSGSESGTRSDSGSGTRPEAGAGTQAGSASSPSLSTSASAKLRTDQIPLTSLDALSEEQLKYLEENTRRGLQERLRILQAVEAQIAESVNVLNRVLGGLPPMGTSLRTEPADPPSPTSASTTVLNSTSATESSTTPSTTAARNLIFGAVESPSSVASHSASQIGLQSLSRTSVERTVSTATTTTRTTTSASAGESHLDTETNDIPANTQRAVTSAAPLANLERETIHTSPSASPMPSLTATTTEAINGVTNDVPSYPATDEFALTDAVGR
ncbi:E3 ubiquitin-protein ligase hrd1, partial [Mortierella polycephala]